MKLDSLRKRSEYSNLRTKGAKFYARNMLIQYYTQSPRLAENSIRYGLIVSKKNGNAVSRNRIKRRIRSAVRQVVTEFPEINCDIDFAVIARKELLDCEFEHILQSFRKFFEKIKGSAITYQ